MRYSGLSALALAALCLTACYEMPASDTPANIPDSQAAPAPTLMPPTQPPVSRDKLTVQAEIDWEAARTDFAARGPSETGVVSIANNSGTPAVPILLPDMQVGVASGDGGDMQFRPTADGYFAVIPGDNYDMIINGTDRLVPSGDNTVVDTELRFEETMTGAQVAFARYGASYLVQFACKGDAAVMGGCIGEDDALAAVQALLIAETR